MERQNRTPLKATRAAHAEGKNWREELNKFLLAYRSTPYSTTGKRPAELFFRGVQKSKTPEMMRLDDEEADTTDQGARERDTQKKKANKDYVDKKFHAREREVRVGDWVLLEHNRENKVSSSYEKEPYEVMTRYGDQVVLMSSNGGEYRRSMHHIKPSNIPDHERAASQSELGSASATAASASATQAMAPKSGTPITTTALPEIPRMSLTSVAVEIPPKVPVSGAEQPSRLRRSVRVTPSKESGRVTGRQKTWSDYVLY